MKVLHLNEIEEVNGGLAPIAGGVVVGAALGGYSAWHGGAGLGQIAAGALLGGVSGFYGGVGMWGSSFAAGVFSSFAGGGGIKRPDVPILMH